MAAPTWGRDSEGANRKYGSGEDTPSSSPLPLPLSWYDAPVGGTDVVVVVVVVVVVAVVVPPGVTPVTSTSS